MTKTLFLLLGIFVCVHLCAQKNTHGPLPVTVADFSPVSALVDSGTEAVVLLDSGSSTIDATPNDYFFLNYYRFRRILIRNKRCLADLAKFTISYSTEMNGTSLKTVKAYTYNLVNGKISKIALSDKDFFTENSKNDYRDLKFAYPDAKEGSIIELEYSLKRHSPNVRNWYFQGEYPVLKSIYTIQIPDVFNFALQFQGKKYLTGAVKETYTKTFYAWINFENDTVHKYTWTYENIPAMREQAFTSTIDNYIGCVKFQVSAIPDNQGISKGYFNDWSWYAKLLLNAGHFGKAFEDPSTMIRNEAKLFAGKGTDDLQMAKGIYSNVRDHFKVSGRGIYMSEDRNLSQIYKSGEGNVADINLILIAMLRSMKIQSDPVILATRDEGLTNQHYPILENYNYLICRSVIAGKEYFLDASSPYMVFGKLPYECYNGHARVITKETFGVFLGPDSLKESSHIVANIRNVNNSNLQILEWTNHTGFYESDDLRTQLKNKKENSIFEPLTELIPFKKSLDSFFISNKNNMEEPMELCYKMTIDLGSDLHIYLNPLLNYDHVENPFKSSERDYPVEMPFTLDKAYELNMDIPNGYEVEEIPKSQKFKLGESDASYEYKVEKIGNRLKIRTELSFYKAIFEPDEYEGLRAFYSAVIKKQGEMIVFRKMKG